MVSNIYVTAFLFQNEKKKKEMDRCLFCLLFCKLLFLLYSYFVCRRMFCLAYLQSLVVNLALSCHFPCLDTSHVQLNYLCLLGDHAAHTSSKIGSQLTINVCVLFLLYIYIQVQGKIVFILSW